VVLLIVWLVTGNPAASQTTVRGGLQLLLLLLISMKGGTKKEGRKKKSFFFAMQLRIVDGLSFFIHPTKTIMFWSWSLESAV